jgi:hypothetical protein
MNLDSATGWRGRVRDGVAELREHGVNTSAQLSYVTGSRNIKGGINYGFGDDRNYIDNRAHMSTLTFNNGSGVGHRAQYAGDQCSDLNADAGVFVRIDGRPSA